MAEEKRNFRTKEIPKQKKETVENLKNLLKESKSIVVVSIKNLPAKQLQLIIKKLRGKVKLKVVKKTLLNRAIDKIEKGLIKKLKQYVEANTALLFSNLDPFELSAILAKNKSEARARPGQTVNKDVVIREGPTELTPGPIISQLGDLGIQFEIKEGKVNIRKDKEILKKGEEVDENKADIMSKFDIKPIEVGLEPIVAYDKKQDKLYEDVKVDIEKSIENLKDSNSKALAFAVAIAYPIKDTIKFLLIKAKSHENTLNEFIKQGGGNEKKTEEVDENNKENAEESENKNKPEEKQEDKKQEQKEDTQKNKQQEEK